MENYEAFFEYFDEHEDELTEIMEELDSYNGFLGEDRIYEMDELDEVYYGESPVWILQRAFFGHDEHLVRDGSGNEYYEPFNPMQPYVYFNGYGNLVSCYEKDYSDLCDKYFVDCLIEYSEREWYNNSFAERWPELAKLIDSVI